MKKTPVGEAIWQAPEDLTSRSAAIDAAAIRLGSLSVFLAGSAALVGLLFLSADSALLAPQMLFGLVIVVALAPVAGWVLAKKEASFGYPTVSTKGLSLPEDRYFALRREITIKWSEIKDIEVRLERSGGEQPENREAMTVASLRLRLVVDGGREIRRFYSSNNVRYGIDHAELAMVLERLHAERSSSRPA